MIMDSDNSQKFWLTGFFSCRKLQKPNQVTKKFNQNRKWQRQTMPPVWYYYRSEIMSVWYRWNVCKSYDTVCRPTTLARTIWSHSRTYGCSYGLPSQRVFSNHGIVVNSAEVTPHITQKQYGKDLVSWVEESNQFSSPITNPTFIKML